MSFSRLLKKVNTEKYIKAVVKLEDIKAQYNPNRFSFWRSLHVGPKKEVLNMFYSPHYRFLNQYKEYGICLAKVNKTSYYKLQKLYGRNDRWIKEKIYKFLDLYEDIRKNGVKKPIIVVNKPLVSNKYNSGLEIFEGHHRTACCLLLGMKEILCKIVRRT